MYGSYSNDVILSGMGPIMGRWNLFLEKNFPLKALTGRASSGQSGQVSLKALGKRVVADQSIMFVALISLYHPQLIIVILLGLQLVYVKIH